MDLTDYEDDELDELRVAVLIEQERRVTINSAPDQADELATRYASAIGRSDGDEWTQPTGAHDAYAVGVIVTHNGQSWESLTPANVWEPGISGWREQAGEGPAEWVQPTGAHDAYALGDQVTFEGAAYESTIGINTWSPKDYPAGWKRV